MSTSRQQIVYEGWLTKSPPSRRVWRAKWRRRWFTLRQTTEQPTQYFLDYFTDRNNRKLKGTINLGSCVQVDAGLQMQRRNNESTGLRGSVFSVRTEQRIYHLEADSVLEMEKWVDVICHVCGLIPTEDENNTSTETETLSSTVKMDNASGPYIAISECITGTKQNIQGTDTSFKKERSLRDSRLEGANGFRADGPSHSKSLSEDLPYSKKSISEITGPLTDTEDESPNVLLMSTHDDLKPSYRGMSKKFTKLDINDRSSMPPRPPKPLHLSQDVTHKEFFVGPRIHEPTEINNARENKTVVISNLLRYKIPSKINYINTIPPTQHGQPFRYDLNYDDNAPSMMYSNVTNPPAVNRGLKPGRSRACTTMSLDPQDISWRLLRDRQEAQKLHYLDLDLQISNMQSSSALKSRTETESPTIYKKVDFVKTEALSMICKDTNENRRNDMPLHD